MLVLPRDLGVLEDLRSKLPATAQEHFLTLALGCIVAMGRRRPLFLPPLLQRHALVLVDACQSSGGDGVGTGPRRPASDYGRGRYGDPPPRQESVWQRVASRRRSI